MDETVMIALITASAGIAGGLTTGAVSAITAARQEKRLDARDASKWRRELAEKDRERLYQVFEQIVAQQKQLFDTTTNLIDLPTPQTRAQQQAASDPLAAANQLALLCSRAGILGASGVGSEKLARLTQQVCVDLRSGPMDHATQNEFYERYNREAIDMRKRMGEHLKRLRSSEME